MKSYKTIKAEIDASPKEAPEPISKFLALNSSGDVEEFTSLKDAKKKFPIEKIQVVISNAAERDEFFKEQLRIEKFVFDKWFSCLREENHHLNDAQFNLIYNKAYEEGHSDGYDAVAERFSDLEKFVLRFIGVSH